DRPIAFGEQINRFVLLRPDQLLRFLDDLLQMVAGVNTGYVQKITVTRVRSPESNGEIGAS
ncbi:MAG: hypothetical protein L0332_34725, partial [Chloroflexi bacterium]|nr:hypothetical protein [Chloroflexota bacterium]